MHNPFIRIKSAVLLVIFALAALGGFRETARAAETKFFAVGNNAWGATNMYAIVPPVGDKYAVVRTLAVLNDQAPGRVAIYTNGPRVIIQAASASLTNFLVQSGTSAGGTNGFAEADQCVICQEGATPPCVRARVAAVTTTNITIFPATAPPWAVLAGSSIWRQGTNQVLVGITNPATSLYNSFITVGQLGQPVVIDTITGAAGAINAVGGSYE